MSRFSIGSLALLALLGLGAAGCENGGGSRESEEPRKLSQAGEEGRISEPDINIYMRVYDANIGDTGTGVGGGGAGD